MMMSVTYGEDNMKSLRNQRQGGSREMIRYKFRIGNRENERRDAVLHFSAPAGMVLQRQIYVFKVVHHAIGAHGFQGGAGGIEGGGLLIFCAVAAPGDGAFVHFFAAQYPDVGGFMGDGVADFFVEGFVRGVYFGAEQIAA